MKLKKNIIWTGFSFAIIISAFLFYWIRHQQTKTIASNKPGTDSTEVNLLLKQGDNYFNKSARSKEDLDSSLLVITTAYQLSKKIDFKKGIGISLDRYSKIYGAQGDTLKGRQYADSAVVVFKNNNLYYELGFAYFNRSGFCSLSGKSLKQRIEWVTRAAEAFTQSGSKLKQADIYRELADLQQIDLNYNDALKNLQKSLALYDSTNCAALIGVYDLLGAVNGIMGNYSVAVKYGLMALNVAEQLNDTTSSSVATIINRVGISYERMKSYPLAFQYYSKGQRLSLLNKDSAGWVIFTHNKSKMMSSMGHTREAIQSMLTIPDTELAKNRRMMSRVHAALLGLYLKVKDYDRCRVYCDLVVKDYAYSKKMEIPTMTECFELAKYYTYTNELKKAESYLQENEILFKKNKLLADLIVNYQLWGKLDSAKGDFAGYIQHLRKYQALRDSALSERNSKEMVQLQIEYETEKKDRDIVLKAERIKLLNAENEVQQANLKQAMLTRNVTVGGVILLIVIIILLYKRYQFNNRIHKKISMQNTSLNLLVTEKEWLLKEIHHRVKNNLQIIISLLDSQSMYLQDNSALSAIRDSQSRVHCMSLIHKKLYQSESIATIDMKVYIKELVDYLSSAFGVQEIIHFELDIDELYLNTSQSIPVGLILNEAITNSIKYAFPKLNDGNKISIQLSVITDQCRLIIRDNGIGLPADFNEQNVKSLGVSLMKGLSEDIDAVFSIKSEQGTYVEVLFFVSPVNPLFEIAADQMVTIK